jgi:hypothetical protein
LPEPGDPTTMTSLKGCFLEASVMGFLSCLSIVSF